VERITYPNINSQILIWLIQSWHEIGPKFSVLLLVYEGVLLHTELPDEEWLTRTPPD
jgi:hypothetical protein